jgi:hypothetical protein
MNVTRKKKINFDIILCEIYKKLPVILQKLTYFLFYFILSPFYGFIVSEYISDLN